MRNIGAFLIVAIIGFVLWQYSRAKAALDPTLETNTMAANDVKVEQEMDRVLGLPLLGMPSYPDIKVPKGWTGEQALAAHWAQVEVDVAEISAAYQASL